MTIRVNGADTTVPETISLTELLSRFEVSPLRVAIEVNEQLVRRKDFDAARLKEGDRVELVTLVGGG